MSDLVKPEVARAVNDNPMLMSLLYDANLLPEQIDTKLKSQILALAVVAFSAGQKSVDDSKEDS